MTVRFEWGRVLRLFVIIAKASRYCTWLLAEGRRGGSANPDADGSGVPVQGGAAAKAP